MRSLVLTSTLVLAGLGSARAQGLPSAESLHAKYIEAAGGRATMAALKARTTWGRVDVPSQGLGGPIILFTAAPDKLYTRVELGGLGTIESGFDGETAWVINPAMGPMVLDGLALNQMRQQADFYSTINPERHIESRETVADEAFEGSPAYKVKVRTKWNEEYHEFYAKDSGFLIGVTRKQSTPMGDIDAVSVLSDYRKMGGITQAGTTTLKVMGIEQVITVDSVSTAAIPDSLFVLPAAIKALKK